MFSFKFATSECRTWSSNHFQLCKDIRVYSRKKIMSWYLPNHDMVPNLHALYNAHYQKHMPSYLKWVDIRPTMTWYWSYVHYNVTLSAFNPTMNIIQVRLLLESLILQGKGWDMNVLSMKGCPHCLKTQKSWKMLCLHPFHLSFVQSVASFTIYKEVTGSQLNNSHGSQRLHQLIGTLDFVDHFIYLLNAPNNEHFHAIN